MRTGSRASSAAGLFKFGMAYIQENRPARSIRRAAVSLSFISIAPLVAHQPNGENDEERRAYRKIGPSPAGASDWPGRGAARHDRGVRPSRHDGERQRAASGRGSVRARPARLDETDLHRHAAAAGAAARSPAAEGAGTDHRRQRRTGGKCGHLGRRRHAGARPRVADAAAGHARAGQWLVRNRRRALQHGRLVGAQAGDRRTRRRRQRHIQPQSVMRGAMSLRSASLLRTAALALLAAAADAVAAGPARPADALLHSAIELSLETLVPLPGDPSNRWADDERAADLGHRLFFEPRLSANGRVSCATCHDASREFQDSVPLAKGVGTTDRRTMPVTATAYSPFLFWDGRKDSQWAQALGPLESAVEHGGTRARYARVAAEHYRADYERIFGPLPDLSSVPQDAGPVADPTARGAWERLPGAKRDDVTAVFVNLGKAIAAYERRIQYGPSRFDRFVSAWKANGVRPTGVLTSDEIAGLELFVGKANCVQCHNGPLLTNNEFHNTGVPRRTGAAEDHGRLAAVAAVRNDEFNCRSRWSDAGPRGCPELDALAAPRPELERAFKVPSLRNVAERAPYMHAGQFATLAEVLEHYNRAPAAASGRTELKPLRLSRTELRQLEAFLRSLSGGQSAPAKYLRAPQEQRS